MSDKNLVIIGALVILAVIAGCLIYLIKTNKLAEFWPETNTQPATEKIEQEIKEEDVGEESEIEEKPVYKETLLTKDDFTITLPAGWQEVLDFPEVLAMVVDNREEIIDEAVIEAGFRTNFSIKKDDLQKYGQDYTVEDYISSIKSSLTKAIPILEFIDEKQGIIHSNQAIFLECQSTQEEIDFKTLLVFIEGNNDIIWAISFNTLRSSWPAYQNLFYQIAESFKLRFEI